MHGHPPLALPPATAHEAQRAAAYRHDANKENRMDSQARLSSIDTVTRELARAALDGRQPDTARLQAELRQLQATKPDDQR